MTPPPAPEPTTTTSASRTSGVAGSPSIGGSSSGRIGVGLGRQPGVVRHVADRGQCAGWVRRPARVGVGQEGQQPAEGLERRSAQGRSRRPPAEQVALASRRITVAEKRTGRPVRSRLTRRATRCSRRASRSRPTWTGSSALSSASAASVARRSGAARHERLGQALQDGQLGRTPAGGTRRRSPRLERDAALPTLGRPRLAAERPVLPVAEGIVGLDQRVQLARALVDHRGLRVAQVALDRELVGVAVRAVDLDGVEGSLDGVLGRVPLRQATSRGCCAGPGS